MINTRQAVETFVSVKDIIEEMMGRIEELEKKCGIGAVAPIED